MRLYGNLKSLRLVFTLVIGLALGVSHNASASLLLEPHLGLNISGTGDQGSTEYDYNGAQYGLRVGYQNLGFMAGLDYTKSSYELESKTAGVTSNNDVSRNEWGLFAGYNFPILVRAWGAYYFSNTMEFDATGTEYSGSTKELGVGFTGLPFLSVNLMYRMVTYDESKTGSVESAINPEFDAKEIVLGVSLPFTL